MNSGPAPALCLALALALVSACRPVQTSHEVPSGGSIFVHDYQSGPVPSPIVDRTVIGQTDAPAPLDCVGWAPSPLEVEKLCGFLSQSASISRTRADACYFRLSAENGGTVSIGASWSETVDSATLERSASASVEVEVETIDIGDEGRRWKRPVYLVDDRFQSYWIAFRQGHWLVSVSSSDWNTSDGSILRSPCQGAALEALARDIARRLPEERNR